MLLCRGEYIYIYRNLEQGLPVAVHVGGTAWDVAPMPGVGLAAFVASSKVGVIDVVQGTVQYSTDSSVTSVRGVAALPNGHVVAGGSGKLFVTSGAGQGESVDLPHSSSVNGMCSLPDGRFVVAQDGSHLSIWRAAGGSVELDCEVTGHSSDVECVKPGPGADEFTSSARDDTCRVWSCQDGKMAHNFTSSSNSVYGCSPIEDGRVWYAGASATLYCSSTNANHPEWSVRTRGSSTIRSVLALPDRDMVLLACDGDKLLAVGMSGDHPVRELTVPPGSSGSMRGLYKIPLKAPRTRKLVPQPDAPAERPEPTAAQREAYSAHMQGGFAALKEKWATVKSDAEQYEALRTVMAYDWHVPADAAEAAVQLPDSAFGGEDTVQMTFEHVAALHLSAATPPEVQAELAEHVPVDEWPTELQSAWADAMGCIVHGETAPNGLTTVTAAAAAGSSDGGAAHRLLTQGRLLWALVDAADTVTGNFSSPCLLCDGQEAFAETLRAVLKVVPPAACALQDASGNTLASKARACSFPIPIPGDSA